MKRLILSILILGAVSSHAFVANFNPPASQIFRVDDYGADGTDEDDDLTAFIAARDAMNAAGGGVIVLTEGGRYYLRTIFNLTASNTGIVGEGSGAVLLPTDDTIAVSLVYANEKDNLVFRNIRFDGNVQNRTDAIASIMGLSLRACSYFIIDNCTFYNMGKWSAHTGNCLGIEILETSNKDSIDGIIRNCKFLDPYQKVRFGIRVWSNWYLDIETREYLHFIRGLKIENCSFVDGIMWNCIELAGYGVQETEVNDCVSVNHNGYASFEADKGCQNATFNRDRVINQNNPSSYTWAFNTSGVPEDGTDGYTHPERRAANVTFNYCTADGVVGNAGDGSMGLRSVLSDNVTWSGGSMKNINSDSSSRAFYEYSSTNITIEDVVVENCYLLFIHVNETDIDGLTINGITASGLTLGIYMPYADGLKQNITVTDNSISCDATSYSPIIIDTADGVTITGNTITRTGGSEEGITLNNVTNQTVSGNTILP